MLTAATRYQQLVGDREPYLTRAREHSKLTIPTLIPPEGTTGGTKLPTPYQSVASRGVIALTAKAMQTLMPPNEPFFRLDVEEYTLSELSENEEVRANVEAALAMIERTTMRAVEASSIRTGFHEAVMQLIVAGNVLVHIRDDGSIRVFRLDAFVIVRDPAGNPLEIVTREEVARETLPPEVAALVPLQDIKHTGNAPLKQDTVKLYTRIVREAKLYRVEQWVNDVPIPGTQGTYPLDLCPWLPLRWNQVDGESYGRAHVETIWGDLTTLEALSKAMTEFAAAAAKVIPMVNPNGVTDENDLSRAENLEFVPGVASDVSFLKIDKYADLQVVKAFADDLTRRVEFHFLMNTSIQRQGERVTAEEIRFMAADLEATIGAVYVLLSQEFQLPLIRIMLDILTRKKRLPKLPKDLVQPTVTTGIDALSRMSDLGKLDRLVAGLRDLYGPEALAQETNVGDYVGRRAAALGIDPTGLIKTPEQKAAEAEQRMQREMMMKMGPNMINQAGQMAQKGMEQ